MKKVSRVLGTAILMTVLVVASACNGNTNERGGNNSTDSRLEAMETTSLPIASEGFSEDENINQGTIDEMLGRQDVVYRDMRMILDPADYESIGGKPVLTQTIKGFKVVPFPLIATLPTIPVEGAYVGDTLYTVSWNEDNSVASAVANYEESIMVLEDLFPKEKAIFLMCGGGGYAGFMKALLIHLGWNPEKIYNVGANWAYEGENAQILASTSTVNPENPIIRTWIIDYAHIDFSLMHSLP